MWRGHWLVVTAYRSGRTALRLGSRLVEAAGQVFQGDVRAGGSSFASANCWGPHRLGELDVVETLTIRWPDGEVSRVEDIATNRIVTVHRE